MILHTLNAVPSSSAFANCLCCASGTDAILLLGEGVYAGLPGTDGYQALQGCPAELYMLDSCASAAGVNVEQSPIKTLSIDEFVALSERFSRNLAWY